MVLALTKNLCKPLAISLFAEIFLRKPTKAGDFLSMQGQYSRLLCFFKAVNNAQYAAMQIGFITFEIRWIIVQDN